MDSFVSCIAAMKVEWSVRKVDSSVWELWSPLQLNGSRGKVVGGGEAPGVGELGVPVRRATAVAVPDDAGSETGSEPGLEEKAGGEAV